MNIIEAMKRSKETGERFRRRNGQPDGHNRDFGRDSPCPCMPLLWHEDILADDWEPVPPSWVCDNSYL